jgi:hypothetical protein
MILLFLVFSLAIGTAPPPPLVWFDGPFNVADSSAIRLDMHTSSPLYHGRVIKVVACSSIDRPFLELDPALEASTGCNSPGFTSQVIFTETERYEKGSLVSKFRVRQTARSLFVRRRLVMRHSPLVYLQAWIELQNERAEVVPGQHVATARFTVVERSTPLLSDAAAGHVVDKTDNSNGVISAILHPSTMHEKDDEEDPLSDNSTLATAYSSFTGLHWSEYSLFIFCAFLFVVGIVAVGIYRGTRKAKYQLRHMSPQSYGDRRNAEDNALIVGWLSAGIKRGLFGERRRGGKSMV